MSDRDHKTPGRDQKSLAVVLTAVVSVAAVFVSAAQAWIAHVNNERQDFRIATQSAREILIDATRRLGAMKDGEYDLESRLAALSSLRLLVVDDLPIKYYEVATDLLNTYVRNNLPDRKRVGPGITVDRSTYRAEDIIAALTALQDVRRATNDRITARLTALDFSSENLTDLDLSGFDFTHSNFEGAFLTRSDLRGANFTHANLTNVAAWDTDFRGAIFDHDPCGRSSIRHGSLGGTRCKGVANPDRAHLRGCNYVNEWVPPREELPRSSSQIASTEYVQTEDVPIADCFTTKGVSHTGNLLLIQCETVVETECNEAAENYDPTHCRDEVWTNGRRQYFIAE